MEKWWPSLAEILETLHVDRVSSDSDGDLFVAKQLDNPEHHIVGGHIGGQALMAASRTVPDRAAHSMHVYLLRAGDARHTVDFTVDRLRDGGTLSTRRVTATQDGKVLLEALVSFSAPADDPGQYQRPMPAVPAPELLPTKQEQLQAFADEHDGIWVKPHPVEQRYVDAPPRLAMEAVAPPERIRMWWRPTVPVPDDPALNQGLLVYVSGTTLLEPAMAMRRSAPGIAFSALIDHSMWFHRTADLSDWVLCDQDSPSGGDGRGLATATMYNRSGELVCSATQELYFGRGQSGRPLTR